MPKANNLGRNFMAEAMENVEKELMNILLEIKQNMDDGTIEGKSRALKLYEELSADDVEDLRDGGESEKIELLEAVEARINEIKKDFAAHGEDMFSDKRGSSPQEASA